MSILENRKNEHRKIMQCLKKKLPVVLHGGSGVGKTELSRLIFNDLGYVVKEVNGCFELDKEDIDIPRSNLKGEKIALQVDEMDRSLQENYDLIKRKLFIPIYKKFKDGVLVNPVTKKKVIVGYKTRIPIIFTCNYISKFKYDENICKRIEIEPLTTDLIEMILLKECKGITEEKAYQLAKSCKGDVRKALDSVEIGEIMKEEIMKTPDLIKRFLYYDGDKRVKLLEDNKVGQYGGIGFEWFLSVLSRNVLDMKGKRKNGKTNVEMDAKILEYLGEYKYVVDKKFLYEIVSCLEENRTRYVKYPKKKKESEK